MIMCLQKINSCRDTKINSIIQNLIFSSMQSTHDETTLYTRGNIEVGRGVERNYSGIIYVW